MLHVHCTLPFFEQPLHTGLQVHAISDIVSCFAAAMPASPFVTGCGSNFSSPVDVAQANAALHGQGRVLIDNLAYAQYGSAAETIVTSPVPMQPQATLGGNFPLRSASHVALIQSIQTLITSAQCMTTHSLKTGLRSAIC